MSDRRRARGGSRKAALKDDVAFLSDRSKPVRDRIAKLFPNEDREPDSAELPDRVIMSIFASDCVSYNWKQRLLR